MLLLCVRKWILILCTDGDDNFLNRSIPILVVGDKRWSIDVNFKFGQNVFAHFEISYASFMWLSFHLNFPHPLQEKKKGCGRWRGNASLNSQIPNQSIYLNGLHRKLEFQLMKTVNGGQICPLDYSRPSRILYPDALNLNKMTVMTLWLLSMKEIGACGIFQEEKKGKKWRDKPGLVEDTGCDSD